MTLEEEAVCFAGRSEGGGERIEQRQAATAFSMSGDERAPASHFPDIE